MPNLASNSTIVRVFDANINRAKEGLRVCEEVARFILNAPSLARQCKLLRHRIDRICRSLASYARLHACRDSRGDVGRTIHSSSELRRNSVSDIFSANIQRAKESIRVLEEFSKIDDVKAALQFKAFRYELYELEKKITQKLQTLR